MRTVTPPGPASQVFTKRLGVIEERLPDPECDRNRLCRDTLGDLCYPGIPDYEEVVEDPAMPLATRTGLLDDRGGIVLGNRVSIADYANVYSHAPGIVDQVVGTNATTTPSDGVRITPHATVSAGVRVREESMVGAGAMATRNVRPHHVNLGVPPKSVRVTPNAPADSEHTFDTAPRRGVVD